ncbi:MAG TPA: lysine--tRNA ligase [Desulfobacterales bacterium]|nr:lysine--tRNA ligase [Desulfobacterales bacterium]
MDKEKTSRIIEDRKEKLEDLKNQNINLYPNRYTVSHTIGEVRETIENSSDPITEEAPLFIVAGRIMAINRFGKTSFLRFRDRTGQLQAYLRKDRLGNESYQLFKQLDVGDFVGLKGGVFQTKTGEWTLLVNELNLLCKSIKTLPEKFHGLKDPEKRYRQRYIDLIMNPNVRDIFLKRSRMIQSIRNFFLDRDFLEVETPMMQPIPGGAEATPFKTYHNALGIDLFLRIAPELYLKRLVVGGFERVFEINRNFRNEGVSTKHNPEFTMLEFYQSYATYEELMDLTEEMFRYVAMEVTGSDTIHYQGNTIQMGGRWPRITISSALKELGGIDTDLLTDRNKLLDFAASRGIQITKTGSLGKIVTKLFDVLVEPKLLQPTFITGYPIEVSPLSRKSDSQPEFAERFELFIGGIEVANGFSELNDPAEQKKRFLQQVECRKAGDEEAHYMDEDYIEALEYGMPPTAGEGIGIDRLAMLLTDSASIREVILFPHMKPVERTKG